ncbi:MAG TPA: hypothetical protein VG165_00595 [Solirubrobacteraceae bacterium]|nr:hypothetical protein [Solirubrobacteraceae bacterium]
MPRAVVIASGIALLTAWPHPALGGMTIVGRAQAAAASAGCLTASVRSRLSVASGGAKFRYAYERDGPAAAAALQQIQDDSALGDDLAAGRLGPAQAAANAQLVNHRVRIQIALPTGRVIGVNPTSFAVAGAQGAIRAAAGRVVGRVEVSIQDILGFVKLGHKFTGAELRVTGRPGHVVSSLPAAVGASLPAFGCVTLAGRRYATRTFGETGFAGEGLTISVLVSA